MSSMETERDIIASKVSEDVECGIVQPSRQEDKEMRERHSKLFRVALIGYWDKNNGIFEEFRPEDITAKISREGDTALHIAAAAAHFEFGIELVEKIDKPEDVLTIKNEASNTAFCVAAERGNVELAKKMLEKNSNLTSIRGREGKLPLCMAAQPGNEEMVKYLYKVTNDHHLEKDDGNELLGNLIKARMFDLALDLVLEYKDIATAGDKNGVTALHSLARIPLATYDDIAKKQQGIWKRRFNKMIIFLGARKKKKMPPHALRLVQLIWTEVMLLGDSQILEIIRKPWSLTFAAAEQGNIEFLNIIFHDFPDLLFEVDANDYSIFHFAVQNRQIDVFNVIKRIDSSKVHSLILKTDKKGNSILHLAAKLPPSDRFNASLGVVFQMQEELLWFEEVKKILPPTVAEAKNKKGKTARDTFTEQHKELKEKGEKWIKDTVSSSLVGATIIATITFAALFTVPGGTNEDTGTPIFLGHSSFKIFVLCDALSLLFSTCSILLFLFIYYSRCEEEDFLLSLPVKLACGLLALYFSVLLMLDAFAWAIDILFKERTNGITVVVAIVTGLVMGSGLPLYVFSLDVLITAKGPRAKLFGPSEGPVGTLL